ncbi:MAG: CDC27 family protein [Bacteroidota bacterium]
MENAKVIFDYLQGNLSAAQEQVFEQRLESDDEFLEEYMLIKQMYSHLRERNDREMYTAKVEELGTKYFNKKPGSSRFTIKNILLLVIATLAILFIVWYILKPQKTELYKDHAKHFALHLVMKSDVNEDAIASEESFNSGNYKNATIAIQKYLNANPMDTKARLALGICHLETENLQEAIEIFDEIRNGTSTLRDYGTWYAALYYVKLEEYEQANEMLDSISENDPQLNKKRQTLQDDLGKMMK